MSEDLGFGTWVTCPEVMVTHGEEMKERGDGSGRTCAYGSLGFGKKMRWVRTEGQVRRGKGAASYLVPYYLF